MDQTTIAQLKELLQTVGLPTMFCWWLMFQVQKRLEVQNETLGKIATSLAVLLEKLEDK